MIFSIIYLCSLAGIGCDTGPNQATDSSRALASAGINPRWVLVRDTSDTLNGVATASSIVGSIQNTLQATRIENNGVATAGTLMLENALNSTADENQAVAEAIVKALGKMLDKAIIDTRTQLKIAESSAQSLTDSIKVAQETADDLGRADIPTTMANLVNDIKALQAAIFAQSLGNKIPEALLELLRSS